MSIVTTQTLAGIPLFSNMDDEERRELHSIMTESIFQPGQVVMKAGEPGANFYIIDSTVQAQVSHFLGQLNAISVANCPAPVAVVAVVAVVVSWALFTVQTAVLPFTARNCAPARISPTLILVFAAASYIP